MPRAFDTVKETAERYKVSERTVRRWVAQNLIQSYKVGPRLIRVDPAEVDAMLRKTGGTGSAA